MKPDSSVHDEAGVLAGIVPSVKDHERLIIAGRLPARPPFELARPTADLSQLQNDLDQLLESFLVDCQQ